MTEYVKSTNFASKDSLASGNPLKIIKGTEFDTEFNNIATAVATKANSADPTFTGVPSAPSPALSATLTQIATVATVQSLYPVGSLYLNASNATNPATLLGFGTWTSFGAGRMPVGFNAADPLFDTAEETGGSKDATLVSHSHSGSTDTASLNGSLFATAFISTSGQFASSGIVSGSGLNSGYSGGGGSANSGGTYNINASHSHGLTTDTQGSSATNANLPPYITVYMWKRTA